MPDTPLRTYALLLGLIIFLACRPMLFAQNKKALVVAIANYPEKSGFRSIHSLNDIQLVKASLVAKGFPEQDIKVITESQATRATIERELIDFATKKLKPGDFFYFHFSGHGQQVQDENGDEVDGLDEAMVPYDAFNTFKPGVYQGERHLTDDRIHELFKKIRSRLGPRGHLLACFDACHSGSATRNIGSPRGGEAPLAAPDHLKSLDRKDRDKKFGDLIEEDESRLAPMVSFFASMPNQLNYEIVAEDGQVYGALSYAFSRSVQMISATDSYQQLFDRIRMTIQQYNSSQVAEAEGFLNQSIFGGEILDPVDYFRVKEVLDENKLVLDAGFLHGLNEGTVVGLFKPESRNERSEVEWASGVVESCQANQCRISLKRKLSRDSAQIAWVKVKESSFGKLLIKVQKKNISTPGVKTIVDSVCRLPYVELVDSYPDVIITEDSNRVLLLSNCELLIKSFHSRSVQRVLFLGMRDVMRSVAQTQMMRRLEQENKDITLEFEFLPVKTGQTNSIESITRLNKTADGKIVFKLGDSIRIKVTNYGKKPAYYSIVDLQPDSKMNVLFPREVDSPSDYFLEPGKSFVIPHILHLLPPAGHELFKIIASKNPVNLRPLSQRRAMGDDQPRDPFSMMINMSYLENESTMTRGTLSSVPAGLVNIFSLPFIIEP